MPPVVSQWNPTGSGMNCMACVARYMFYQVKGKYLADATSRSLELMSEPETVQGHVPNIDWQMKSAIRRTIMIIESVGFKAADRHEAFVGRTKYPNAGHYALLGLSGGAVGHVIYGRIDTNDSDFRILFCPQTNLPVTLGGRLGGRALAIRFV